MKYILLQGLAEGNRFFSDNVPDMGDQTKLDDGTVAYKILGYADSVCEAQRKLLGKCYDDECLLHTKK